MEAIKKAMINVNLDGGNKSQQWTIRFTAWQSHSDEVYI